MEANNELDSNDRSESEEESIDDSKTSDSPAKSTTTITIKDITKKQAQVASTLMSSFIKIANKKDVFKSSKKIFNSLNKLNTKHILCHTRSKEKALTNQSVTFSNFNS